MMFHDTSHSPFYEGWEGFQRQLVRAVGGLTAEQLAWRPAPGLRSAGELARHIALGRVNRLLVMQAPGVRHLAGQIDAWAEDAYGSRIAVEETIPVTGQANALGGWLEATWQIIDYMLKTWNTADLRRKRRHTRGGVTYLLTNERLLWQLLAHELHHGGELDMILEMQGLGAYKSGGLSGLPAVEEASGWQSVLRRFVQ